MTTATKVKTQIKQASICRCTDKATREVFYAVKSDSSDTYYHIRFDNSRLAWTCNCPAMKPCKHERAVQEVLAIRRGRIAQEMGGEAPAIVARMQAEDDAKRAAYDTLFDPHGCNLDMW